MLTQYFDHLRKLARLKLWQPRIERIIWCDCISFAAIKIYIRINTCTCVCVCVRRIMAIAKYNWIDVHVWTHCVVSAVAQVWVRVRCSNKSRFQFAHDLRCVCCNGIVDPFSKCFIFSPHFSVAVHTQQSQHTLTHTHGSSTNNRH